MKYLPLLLATACLAGPLVGVETNAVRWTTNPTRGDLTTRGDLMVAEYFRNETALLASRCLADIRTLDDWKAHRDEYRWQLQEMLGLWPAPERTDLQPVITGRLEHPEFTVEKIQFQAAPHLYCTANLYLPKQQERPAPTILYECGHFRSISNGVSYGNKPAYQQHGAWFARNGYVCLVLDTLLAGEIQGVHTGTRDLGQWWWNAAGYTPAGVEAWFGMRALDYLSTRPEVDTNRFGITGHSGGGAYSWTVAALDERIKVAAPLAGLTDLQNHVVDGVVDSHCDCNFFINTYRWDAPQVAALLAPRPLLFGTSDRDRLFWTDATLRLHEKVKRIYALHGATEKLGLIISPGPHADLQEHQVAVMRWFNQHLKGVAAPVDTAAQPYFAPPELKVFARLPGDAINTNIAASFVPAWVQTNQSEAAALLAKCFNGWPAEGEPLEPQRAFAVERDGLKFSAWDFTSQHDVPLRVYFLERAQVPPAGGLVLLNVLADADWDAWLGVARSGFEAQLGSELAVGSAPGADAKALAELRRQLESGVVFAGEDRVTNVAALACFAPRGTGLTAFAANEKARTRIRRRFMLLGQTWDGMRVWDIRRAVQLVHFVREGDPAQVALWGHGPMSRLAGLAGGFEPSVRQVVGGGSAATPDLLNLRRVLRSEAAPQAERPLTR
jgi:dienelactone hydrolase